ncbi:MAG: DUF4136 domain-containing protein [Cyclobacteriaceae bacterium]|nr:DUF4136 domain-containing protein [Cyclobacteriaceae bacterium]
MKYYTLLIVVLTATSCSKIVYQVSTLKDPNLKLDSMSFAKYALRTDSLQVDKLMEANLLNIIKTEFSKKAWKETSIDSADFIFEVKFGMESGQETGSRTITVYEPKSGKYVPQQRAYSATVYKRNIIINSYSPKSQIPIWSADCISEGSTNNIYLPGTYMLPFALSMFPQQGNWTKTAFIKK